MKINEGVMKRPLRFVMYGPEGIGKTTFASKFPDPLFIDTEGSSLQYNVRRLGPIRDWNDVQSAFDYVEMHPDCCKTLIVDTADWAEHMMIKEMTQKDGMDGLEGYGFGKGYQYAMEKFKSEFISRLDKIWTRNKINIVVTGHANLRKIELPEETGSYDHWEMKLTKKNTPLLKEWADVLLFATFKTNVIKVDGMGDKHKATGTGTRIMHTQHHSCWDAKNRYGLDPDLPFDYKYISHLIEDVPEVRDPEPEHEPVKEIEKTEYTGFPIDEKIPASLKELMERDGIDENDIQTLVASKGKYPINMPVCEYDREFIENGIVAKWDGFARAAKKMRETQEIPF